MSLSLWWGPLRLGELFVHDRSAEGITAVLSVDPNTPPSVLKAMTQTRLGDGPNARVFQSDDDALKTGSPSEPAPTPVPLRKLSEEEARGVPPERQLYIRDELETELPTKMILLSQLQASDGSAPLTNLPANRTGLWSVAVVLDDRAIL